MQDTVENSLAAPQKQSYHMTQELQVQENWKYTFTQNLFMNAHRYIIHNSKRKKKKKQPKCSSNDEKINKWQYIYTTEYHSAMKNYEVSIHATKWMSFRSMTLNERRHRRPHVWLHLYQKSLQSQETDYELMGTGGREGWGVTAPWLRRFS